MSEPFLKSLECSCIKGTSATCPGGGEVDAFLGLNEGALSATIENDSRIVSPAEEQLHGINTQAIPFEEREGILDLSGSGPYYVIKINFDDFGPSDIIGVPFSELDIGDGSGWQVKVTAGEFDIVDGYDQEAYYDVINVFSDDRLLVFGENDLITDYTSSNYVRLEGFGNPTPPNATIVKSFGNGNILLEG